MAAQKPIFCATHPRACSTAFERVFMTRQDLSCAHEPFGDAFYYGPERISDRYANDEASRQNSGFATSTYKTIFDRLEEEGKDGKRVFIKDMIYYLLPINGKPPQLAPSLHSKKRGIGTESNGHANGNGHIESKPFPYGTTFEPGNPTIVPDEYLQRFQWTFLIRDPHYSIPSYYRCTIPPLDEKTGFAYYDPSEAGYDEIRRLLDYLINTKQLGPAITGQTTNGGSQHPADICVVDADDLLDHPEQVVQAYCGAVGLDYSPDMLKWGSDENQKRARDAFEKWNGFHEDALDSTELRAREHKKARKTEEEFDCEWVKKYGLKGAALIRQTVDESMPAYLYLKQFALKV